MTNTRYAKRYRLWLYCVTTVALAIGIYAPVKAVINQVDGQVVPILFGSPCPGAIDQCIQTALNYGEGSNPPSVKPANPVDAVLDANTGPETFQVPKDTAGKFVSVTYKLLQEGAGYENIFGWYNVGYTQERYPVILSCAFGKKAGATGYEPPYYSGTLLTGGFSATVDFEQEFQSKRYKGGQIGFYLVTPEGSTNENLSGYVENCATDPNDRYYSNNTGVDDDNTGSAYDDSNGFGRIYFTESKLNNDGNYVHYLIYQSKLNATSFYFGFEDLFRGGDGDFDDTLVKVEGLVPKCQPAQEVCNGKDDNCNNQIDENLYQDCYTPTDTSTASVGECKKGKQSCTGSSYSGPCVGEVTPTKEVCDGKDNDCNGKTDDGLTRACSSKCSTGIETCKFISGSPSDAQNWFGCTAPKPSSEICDGKDNDCNGSKDENLSRICKSICGLGVETCTYVSGDPDASANWTGCTAPLATTEFCDGVDNDCNGSTDDKVPGEGLPCDHPSGKTCQKGLTKCVGGKITCVGATQGGLEVCDCKDNDCDNQIDEDNPCPTGTKCLECGCRIPCTGSEFGCPKGFACKNSFCVPDNCANVTCKENEKCVGGQCVSLCTGVTCGIGQVCKDGFCYEDSCYGTGCPTGQVCYQKQCIPHPCNSVTCKDGEFCENGICRPSCAGTLCGSKGRCQYGQCVPNPCIKVVCEGDAPCVEGQCDTGCTGVSCGKTRICKNAQCVDSPCTLVKCYGADETCVDGQCVSNVTYSGEVLELVASGGGAGGCSMPSPSEPSIPLALPLWLLVLGLLLISRRGDR